MTMPDGTYIMRQDERHDILTHNLAIGLMYDYARRNHTMHQDERNDILTHKSPGKKLVSQR
jgi:hypothetical protein